MPWTKLHRPIKHQCQRPLSVDHRDNGDEWTCDYCGQVWVVRTHMYGGKPGRKALEEVDPPPPRAPRGKGSIAT